MLQKLKGMDAMTEGEWIQERGDRENFIEEGAGLGA